MAIATFEGNMTLHDVLDVAEWDMVLAVVEHGQRLVSEREERWQETFSNGFNAILDGLGSLQKGIGNVQKTLANIFK